MKRYLTYSFLLSALFIGAFACKSSKNPITQTEQASKRTENNNPNLAKAKKERQKNEVDTVSNLKSLGDKKVYKDFKDSIENGIIVLNGYGGYYFKADSIPQILTDLFPDAYFMITQAVYGYAPVAQLTAIFKQHHYGSSNINALLNIASFTNKISKEQQIRVYFAFKFFHTPNSILEINVSKRRLGNTDFDYLVRVKTSKGSLELLVAFMGNGDFFRITNVTDNVNDIYAAFEYADQF